MGLNPVTRKRRAVGKVQARVRRRTVVTIIADAGRVRRAACHGSATSGIHVQSRPVQKDRETKPNEEPEHPAPPCAPKCRPFGYFLGAVGAVGSLASPPT